MVSNIRNPATYGPLLAIHVGGFVAGTLDIGAAALISSMSPVRILKIVAGGLLGRPALDGGTGVAALGMVLQWVMSLIIAAVYVIAARRIPRLRAMWVRGGIAYGVVVFAVMNYVVVPLSAWDRFPRFTPLSYIENLLAMILFGVIIAWACQRFDRAQADSTAG
jgi:uncharacterized membrane protein (DUF485 family)